MEAKRKVIQLEENKFSEILLEPHLIHTLLESSEAQRDQGTTLTGTQERKGLIRGEVIRYRL